MTSEIRPAVEVWRQAHQALYWLPKGTIGEQGAAAVIEADREAVRAEQAAEVERLRKLIEATSAHFLRLNTDHPIMWEGAIDGAMEAVCQEVERQAAELAKFKALAETLAGALEQYDQGCAAIGGCSDGYCVIQRPKGMHTNGGCRCSDDRNRMRRFASRAAYFREKVAEALRQYKEARDV